MASSEKPRPYQTKNPIVGLTQAQPIHENEMLEALATISRQLDYLIDIVDAIERSE